MTTAIQPNRTNTCARITTLLLALLLLSLAGCSSVRLVYGHLDWWMDRTLNKYLDLDGPQKELLSRRVDEFHRWHRQTQLPRYADYMEQLATQVDSPDVSPKNLKKIEKQVDDFWHSSVVMLSDLLLPILVELDDNQINQLAENARKEREKSLKKWDKSQRKREKQFRKQAERWLGDLTAEQQAMIDKQVAETSFNPASRIAQRELWTNTFLDTLRNKPQGYESKLRKLLIDPQTLWPDDYRQMQDALRDQGRTLATGILESTTPEQRAHMQETLLEFASDFRHLAAQQH
uniref:DUF6279 family lipoprotein n=1 Tax=Microbulbifer agarilyticus TaxID=260552 RepID=UPI000255A469|nr:DUF6279 family lipoprotein [Microbulbifer agarilyticus]